MPYVVTSPHHIRGIYETWPECQAATSGVVRPRYMKVSTWDEGEAILREGGVVLDDGLYAFTDGSGSGGVGVLIVRGRGPADPEVVSEIATNVRDALRGAAIVGLDSDDAVAQALDRLHNILAELVALHVALRALPKGSTVTIVHDYAGVGSFMTEWKPRDPHVKVLVSACRGLIEEASLNVRFVHQAGHRSSWAGRHDYAALNARADQLATQGGSSQAPRP